MDPSPQEAVLSWLSFASRNDRLDFIKSLLTTVREDKIKAIKNLVTNSLKKKKKAQVTSVPASVPTAPVPEVKGWWTTYQKKNIVAYDCEMVSLVELDKETGKHLIKGATVAVIDFWNNTIYEAVIKHLPGTFNLHTKNVNGFSENSLQNGEEITVVVEKIKSIFDGKLVVTCNSIKDFECVGLDISEYITFDLHQHFRKSHGQNDRMGNKVLQPISLRSLYFHYFGDDIQSGVHKSEKDARATMSMFHKYTEVKTTNLHSKHHDNLDDEFSNIKKLK